MMDADLIQLTPSGSFKVDERDHFYLTVGESIRAAREASGLTMAELSRKARLPVSAIRNAESGESCQAHVLALIAEAFDCQVDDLIPTDATPPVLVSR